VCLGGIPFGCGCLTEVDVESDKGANALNGRCGCAVFECRSGSFVLALACCNDPRFGDEDALTSGGLTDGDNVDFAGVDIFGPLVTDRIGVTVLFADAIPYALAGTIDVVVVILVVVVDDFDLGACFFKSSSSFHLL